MDFATDIQYTREFLAVILAGYGSGLHPLTSDHVDDPCPKALLPVANKPMIDYTLEWIGQSGIRDVLIICPSIQRPAISHHIDSDVSLSLSSLRIDIQVHDESQDTGVGTCAPIRALASRIPEDFVLLPCDFIPPPSLTLSSLLNKFRTDTLSDGSIATSCWFETRTADKGSASEEWGPSNSPVPIIWHRPSLSLLYIDTTDDINRNSDELELRMSLALQYPFSKLSAIYQDSGVYVCRHSVLDVLREETEFESFREEFLPWLCKLQYQRTKRERHAKALENITNASQHMALQHSSRHVDWRKIKKATGSQANMTLDATEVLMVPSLRIGLVIHCLKDGPTARVNTLTAYLDTNRLLLSNAAYTLPVDPKNRILIDQKAQISTDSIIGDSTKVEERTTIKRSVVGRHCIIGKAVKIVGCVLLDHCIVEDGAKIDGCLLGKNTKVGTKADLSRCVTQAGYEIAAGDTFKNEKLEVSDWAAPITSESEDNTDGPGEESEGSENSDGESNPHGEYS